jgi:hypothetical protein
LVAFPAVVAIGALGIRRAVPRAVAAGGLGVVFALVVLGSSLFPYSGFQSAMTRRAFDRFVFTSDILIGSLIIVPFFVLTTLLLSTAVLKEGTPTASKAGG